MHTLLQQKLLIVPILDSQSLRGKKLCLIYHYYYFSRTLWFYSQEERFDSNFKKKLRLILGNLVPRRLWDSLYMKCLNWRKYCVCLCVCVCVCVCVCARVWVPRGQDREERGEGEGKEGGGVGVNKQKWYENKDTICFQTTFLLKVIWRWTRWKP